MSEEKCSTCVYYGYQPGTDLKVCKRFPPRTLEGGGVMWPRVSWADWCGEYKRQNVDTTP